MLPELLLLAAVLSAPARGQNGLDTLGQIAREQRGAGQHTRDQSREASELLVQERESILRGYPDPDDPNRVAALAHLDYRARVLASVLNADRGVQDQERFCRWARIRDSPDGDLGIGSTLGAGAILAMMNYGGGETDSETNTGLVTYLGASVDADCSLFRAAYLFYRDLKRADLAEGRPPPHDPRGASMGSRAASNLLQSARAAVRQVLGRDDPYLAFKVLVLYGHDNMNNYLEGHGGNSCQRDILDAIRPTANSNLYLNGAIGPSYSDADVQNAQRINAECLRAARNDSERALCSGGYSDYQADYYHVIAAAFLHCAARAQAIAVAQNLQETEYLAAVRQYKITRFSEQIRRVNGASPPPAMQVLEWAWGRYVSGQPPAEADFTNLCRQAGCREGDLAAARAIYARFAFEVDFRVRQHRLGIEAARTGCAGATPRHPLSCWQLDL